MIGSGGAASGIVGEQTYYVPMRPFVFAYAAVIVIATATGCSNAPSAVPACPTQSALYFDDPAGWDIGEPLPGETPSECTPPATAGPTPVDVSSPTPINGEIVSIEGVDHYCLRTGTSLECYEGESPPSPSEEPIFLCSDGSDWCKDLRQPEVYQPPSRPQPNAEVQHLMNSWWALTPQQRAEKCVFYGLPPSCGLDDVLASLG